MTGVVLDGSLLLAIPIAMLAGLVSFLSPCVLPLAPGYLAYVTGLTGADLAAQTPPGAPGGTVTRVRRGRVVLAASLFVAGFTVVFMSFGLAFGGLGGWLLEHQRTIGIVLGALVVVLGLGFLGLPGLGDRMWFNRERRMGYRPPAGVWGAPLLGVLFGLGWTPCIGPTLAAVQSLAFTQASAGRGAVLSLAYGLGLGVPFLLIAWGLRWSAGAMNWTKRHFAAVSRVGGVLLIAIGVLVMTGAWAELMIWVQTRFPAFEVAI